ncbi:SAM-dependent methyltransferase [Phaeacidiphilus oryzae]|uniref:SAM-dependent methyltransferase n=1 Tax=Phaeacidiphilus oryzae TaxID=348818 RepID=UPI0005617603|nr:cyclopropane-fatty-acyl-phospholipid synthase family protein [Phaeacidiphilus oryzae]
MSSAAGRLAALAEQFLGAPLPIRIRAWDGSEAGPQDGGPVLVIADRRALRRILYRPGELGLARAWVAGELNVEGDLYAALDRLAGLIWERDEPAPEARSAGSAVAAPLRRLRGAARMAGMLREPRFRAQLREVAGLTGIGLPPRPPAEEARPQHGIRHTLGRDRSAISHHYDVGNRFYELVLGASMVYSCAYWEEPEARTGDGRADLERAQFAKLDLVCRKLDLKPGQRLLDVGCGWGSMALHAAKEYGVSVVGVTLSREQAAYARKRVADAGLEDRIDIRVQDYRELDPEVDGPFDAISSIGMAEHVGAVRYREYADRLYALLREGGRLLNHQIARRPLGGEAEERGYRVDEFIDRYVFPDGELQPVGTTVSILEQAGFEVRDQEALREHYALTLRQWVANLESGWSEALRLVSAGRARVWRLYMAASALAFERNRIGVNQLLAVRTTPAGVSGLRLRRGGFARAS